MSINPSKPTVLVLGSTGQVGQLVVKESCHSPELVEGEGTIGAIRLHGHHSGFWTNAELRISSICYSDP